MQENKNNVFDTAIAALWFDGNYGITVSTYSLYKLFQKLGYKPMLLTDSKNLEAEQQNYESFIENHCFIQDENNMNCKNCKNFVVGSGNVWKFDNETKRVNPKFLGLDLDQSVNKISCASSFERIEGDDILQENLLEVRQGLNQFKNISVRSASDIAIAQTDYRIFTEEILDPILLNDLEEFQKDIVVDSDELYIFSSISQPNKRIKKYIQEAIRVKQLPVFQYDLELPNVEEWISKIANAQFIITDSYYLVCMAILFKKPFVVIEYDNQKNNDEITELLEMLELEERIVMCDEYSDLKDYVYLFRKNINYKRIENTLETLKKESLEWIKKQLV